MCLGRPKPRVTPLPFPFSLFAFLCTCPLQVPSSSQGVQFSCTLFSLLPPISGSVPPPPSASCKLGSFPQLPISANELTSKVGCPEAARQHPGCPRDNPEYQGCTAEPPRICWLTDSGQAQERSFPSARFSHFRRAKNVLRGGWFKISNKTNLPGAHERT